MHTTLRPGVFDQLTALSDPTRSRILHALDGRELTVTELCAVLQLPQSTVSRHLKILSDDGWVASRAEGTSRFYRLDAALDDAARQLWAVVSDRIAESAAGKQDARRVESVIRERRSRSQEFFSSAAGQWSALRNEMFGERPVLTGTLAFLDPSWVLADLGCGTGEQAATVAPFVQRVLAVDASESMLEAARRRLDGVENVELHRGELEALPLERGVADAALLSLVLHYVAEPAKALGEAARILRPGGRLVVIDMMPHDREEYRQQMGHVWQGFAAEQIDGWLAGAGFTRVRYQPLPVEPQAKGPALFVAAAERKE